MTDPAGAILVCSGALSDRSNEGGSPRQPHRSAATFATRGKEAQFLAATAQFSAVLYTGL